MVGGSAAIQALHRFASDSSSPDLQAEAINELAGIFSAFSARLEISAKTGFELNVKFTLGTGSDGISPPAEDVTLQLGSFFQIIPAGSFKANKNGSLEFAGVLNGTSLEIHIKQLGNGSFDISG